MDSVREPASTTPASRSSEALVYALTTLAICIVMHPVLLHPTEMLFSPVSDVLPGHHPYRILQLRSLAEWGRIALWDPTAFGGAPLISDPQSGIYYPLNWLNLLAPGEEGFASYSWTVLIHLLIGALGMTWWLGRQGFGGPARVAGALVFSLSGKWLFHVLWKGHIIFLPIVWLPWQLGLIDDIARRPNARSISLLALSLALMIVGCHPQLLLYALILVGAYAGWAALRALRGRAERPLRVLGGLALAGALALALSAAHLLPILDGMADFSRGAGFDYAEVVRRSLELEQWIGFLVAIPLPTEPHAVIFVSALSFGLSVFALLDQRRRGHAIFFAAITLFFLWYGLGDGALLYRVLFDHVPGFSLFRIPNRALLILGLPFAWMSAAGLGALCEAPATPARRWAAAGLCALGVGLALALRSADAGVAAAALTLPLLCLTPIRARLGGTLAWGVTALLFVELALFASRWVQVRPAETALGHNPVAERLRGPMGRERVYAFNQNRSGDFSSLPITYVTRAGIESLRGFNPLIPYDTVRYLQVGAGGANETSRHATTIVTFPIASRAHLDLFNVRWIVTNHPLDVAGLALRERFDDLQLYHFQSRFPLTLVASTYLYENLEVLPRAALVRDARHAKDFDAALAAIPEIDPRRVVLLEDAEAVGRHPGEFTPVAVEHRGDELLMALDAGGGGYLLVSEVFLPGWQAEVDGEPTSILRANALFRALQLGPGQHRVRMFYRPRAVGPGQAISLAGLVVMALGIGLGGRPRDADAAPTPPPAA
jgi:hypothetical protein